MLLFINELKHKAESIFNLEDTSFPFISEEGRLSAYPNFCAFSKASSNDKLYLSIEDKIKFDVPLKIPCTFVMLLEIKLSFIDLTIGTPPHTAASNSKLTLFFSAIKDN